MNYKAMRECSTEQKPSVLRTDNRPIAEGLETSSRAGPDCHGYLDADVELYQLS